MEDKITLMINDYIEHGKISLLKKKYNSSRNTIRKLLDEYGISIPKRNNYFSNKLLNEEIIRNYGVDRNLINLSKKYNIPVYSLRNFLKKRNLFKKHHKDFQTRRKFMLNENFFDIIDCEEKAYFLGFLYADGTNSTKKTEISLRLNGDEDSYILYELKDLLKTNKPISTYQGKGGRKLTYRMTINSKYMSYRLNDIGVIPNKTFKLKFPNWLNENLYSHFIRGYFDGDGGVQYYYKNGLSVDFTGTENMILSIQDILIENCKLNKTKLRIRHPERNNNIRSLNYCGNGNTKKIYDYIYNDASLYLKRKKNKFEKYLNKN